MQISIITDNGSNLLRFESCHVAAPETEGDINAPSEEHTLPDWR